jgi:phytoene dehydrogenase-like protein
VKRILVIGAGLGGLAAAIRLAHAGHAVEVWEKNDAPGGKLQELQRDGFSWGTGPSILTMPVNESRTTSRSCGSTPVAAISGPTER